MHACYQFPGRHQRQRWWLKSVSRRRPGEAQAIQLGQQRRQAAEGRAVRLMAGPHRRVRASLVTLLIVSDSHGQSEAIRGPGSLLTRGSCGARRWNALPWAFPEGDARGPRFPGGAIGILANHWRSRHRLGGDGVCFALPCPLPCAALPRVLLCLWVLCLVWLSLTQGGGRRARPLQAPLGKSSVRAEVNQECVRSLSSECC